MMDKTRAENIREWSVDQATIVFDNDEKCLTRLTDAAMHAVYEGCGYRGMQPDDYRDMMNREPYEIYRNIGIYVCDEINDIVSEFDNNLMRELVESLLDMGDSLQVEKFGERYAPSVEDYEEWYNENVLGE
jgi:nitrogen regulatory protein PII-like uncharacterized protein